MNTKKQLYPLKFIPIPSRRIWGGNWLISELGKTYVENDEEGNEVELSAKDKIGESWEIADMGIEDSVVAEGWLAGNELSEIMETYLERIVGEHNCMWFGRQFPVLVKYLDIEDKISVQVHPDDEIAEERYDALGKSELWYVMDAKPGAKAYVGFKREVTAQELYDRCLNGTIVEVLNEIEPKKGDVIIIKPGTVHSACGGLKLVEIQESSDMVFRLYDWGRENNPATRREMHLEEAIDMINYAPFDPSHWIKAEDMHQDKIIDNICTSPEFTVNKINLTDPLHIYTDKFGSFIVYMCVEGAAEIKVKEENEDKRYTITKGETILIPADMPDFFVHPKQEGTVLLETMVEKREEIDEYIDPETEAFLEGEDYDGLEDEYGDNKPLS